MSIKWCGTLESSSFVGLAVPMSIPLYICIESEEIISPLYFFASSIAKAVLPTAVGPTIAKTFMVISFQFQLFYKHGIAKREESILLFNRCFICLHNLFLATQGANKHEQSALWQVKVSN